MVGAGAARGHGAAGAIPATSPRDSAIGPPTPALPTTSGPDTLIGPPAPGLPNPRPPASLPPGARADSTHSTFEFVTSAPDSSDAEAERVLNEAAVRRRARAHAPVTTKRFDAPRWVMLRSALVPGWGQLHNHSWIKALGVAGGELAFLAQIWKDERDLTDLQRNIDAAQGANNDAAYNAAVDAYNSRLADETNQRWLLGGLLAYALVDAYVDAHFANFKVEFQPPPSEGKKKDTGARLRVGWSF